MTDNDADKTTDKKDPRHEAEDVQDERARAATSEEERRKIRDQPVEPLLNEHGRAREWD